MPPTVLIYDYEQWKRDNVANEVESTEKWSWLAVQIDQESWIRILVIP